MHVDRIWEFFLLNQVFVLCRFVCQSRFIYTIYGMGSPVITSLQTSLYCYLLEVLISQVIIIHPHGKFISCGSIQHIIVARWCHSQRWTWLTIVYREKRFIKNLSRSYTVRRFLAKILTRRMENQPNIFIMQGVNTVRRKLHLLRNGLSGRHRYVNTTIQRITIQSNIRTISLAFTIQCQSINPGQVSFGSITQLHIQQDRFTICDIRIISVFDRYCRLFHLQCSAGKKMLLFRLIEHRMLRFLPWTCTLPSPEKEYRWIF